MMGAFIRSLLFAAALAVSAALPVSRAEAQSTCPYIANGAVLTAAQWNQCFANKQNTLGYVPVNKAGDVMLGRLVTTPATAGAAGFNLPQGTAPSSPANGDVWTTLSGMFARINGVTIGPFAGAGSGTFAATSPISVTFPAGVVTYALNYDANFSVVSTNLALASGGVAYPSGVTGGAKGAGTINATGLYVSNVAVVAGGISSLTTDVVATGPGAAAATIQANVVSYAKFQQVAASSLVGNPTAGLANAQGVTLGATLAFSGTALQTAALTGDITSSANSFVTTLATVNSNVGSFGSSTAIPTITVNGKGLITAVTTNAVIAPAGTLTGATLAANVLSSSLTSVGALTGGSATTGFTINAANVTWSGQIPGANVAPAANASGAPSATFGVVKGDGTTITISAGVMTAVGGVATSVQTGTTTVTSGTTTRVLYNNAGVLGEYVVSGSGNVCMTTSCVMTTPNLGTPSAVTLTNGSGLPIAGITGLGTGVGTALAVNTGSNGSFGVRIAGATKALNTNAITSGSCDTTTDTATGAATSDTMEVIFASDPTAVTGYVPSTSGGLNIYPFVTSNTANFKVCNPTTVTITPGAISVNWKIYR